MQIQGKFIDPNSFKVNTATGDSSSVAFNLSDTPISVFALGVYLNGLKQRPTTDFTLSGNTVTFNSAPETDTDIDFEYIKK